MGERKIVSCGGGTETPAVEVLDVVQPVVLPDLTTCPLADFASAVHAAIAAVGNGEHDRFGARKVFIAAIANQLGISGGRFRRFTQRLLEARRAHLLDLARADLVAAMHPIAVAASEISDLGSTFHFVIDRNAREPWEVL